MKKQVELKNKLLKIINPIDIYKDFFPQLENRSEDTNKENQEVSSFCPFHDDESGKGKSFSFNLSTGAFNCFNPECGTKGSNVVNFYEKINNLSFDDTLRHLYGQYIRPIIKYSEVTKWHDILMASPKMLEYLTSKRLIAEKIIKDRKIGYDGNRITIPVFNEFGLCVNVRKYNPSAKAKMISYAKGYGKNYIYPSNNTTSKEFILTEGEWDALCLESFGFKAISFTAGAGAFPDDTAKFFENKDVIIAYDSDEAGQVGALKMINVLKSYCKSIRLLTFPKFKRAESKDASDYFIEGNTRESFALLMEHAKYVHQISHKSLDADTNGNLEGTKKDNKNQIFKDITLIEASNAKYYYQKIRFKARVSGKETSPYYMPKKVLIECTNYQDHDCFCADSRRKSKIFSIDLWDKNVIKLISTTDNQRDAAILETFEISSKCKAKVEILEQHNADQVRLTPDLDFSDGSKFIARRGIYIGSNIDSNKSYEFEGYTVPDPHTQQIVHILVKKNETSDSLDNFFLSPRVIKTLKKFKPVDSRIESIRKKFNSIAMWQADHVTKIRNRLDLHILVDLCFTSVDSLKFDDEVIHKAMLEVLILGDTRCGKGMIAEGLSKYYQLGRVASGENCTYAGLVGGVQQMTKGFLITWGLIPEQDKGLYIIDEVSSMSTSDIGKMSRVRSEGIAEITKIVTEKTLSKARGIWISNSRTGKDLQTYNTGCEAIPELIGSMEDVSRFDLFIIAAKGDVSSEIINVRHKSTTNKNEYSSEDFKNLALWAWSRSFNQVKFIPKAINLIYTESIRLGKKYSAAIPLVQSENIRIKLSKISTAVAAKCFSTYNDYSGVLVKSSHVEYAVEFLEKLLDATNFGYDLFSKSKLAQDSLTDEDLVDDIMMSISGTITAFVDGILDQKRLSISDISDFTGKDKYDTKEIIGKLVRLRCIQKENTYYIKKPAFIKYLRNIHLKKFYKELI